MPPTFLRPGLIVAVFSLFASAAIGCVGSSEEEAPAASDSALMFGSSFLSPLNEGVYDQKGGGATLTVYSEGTRQKVTLVVNGYTCKADVDFYGEPFVSASGAFDSGHVCHLGLQPSAEGGIYVTDSVHGHFLPRSSPEAQ